MKVLDWQKQTREGWRAAQVKKEREEKDMLKTQWHEEDSRAKKVEEERARQMRELNLELIQHNELEKGLKSKMTALEKDRDKHMISAIVQENQKQAELEAELKQRRLAEAKEMLKAIDNRSELQRREEQEIERLAEEEKNKQIAREDAKFQREQEARIALMKDVYSDREAAVSYKSM
jgi:colicin import membrane protein